LWMTWCFRTGHGNTQAASEHARKYFETLEAASNPYQLDRIAFYYLLLKQNDKALVVLKQILEKHRWPWHAMHVVLIADAAGNAAVRDEYLKKVIDMGGRNESGTDSVF